MSDCKTVVLDGEPILLENMVDGEFGVFYRVGENPTTEEITVKSTDETVDVYPTNAQYISKVTVEGITGVRNIMENGTHDVLNDKQVIVNVQPDLMVKTVVQNGSYLASDDGVDGYSRFDVEIPEYSGSYHVPMSTSEQILQTEGKVMTDDVTVEGIDVYEGTYTVTPSTSEQVLQTAGKLLEENVVVEAEDVYEGSYSVTPSTSQQTLATNGKVMEQDVTVEALNTETWTFTLDDDSTVTKVVGVYDS